MGEYMTKRKAKSEKNLEKIYSTKDFITLLESDSFQPRRDQGSQTKVSHDIKSLVTNP